MQAPRPLPQCTRTMAAPRAFVCVCCVSLFVCPGGPLCLLRHVKNAAGEVGDERKERGRKGQEDGIFGTRQFGVTCLMWLCQCSLPAVHLQ